MLFRSPPSRHIYRQSRDHGLLVADIKACHHGQLIGNGDPLIFRPERWQEISAQHRKSNPAGTKKLKATEAELGYMPFAFVCPSDKQETRAFGLKMIALLVGVMLNKLRGYELERLDSLPVIGMPLELSRDSYLDLCLRKK